MTDYFQAFWLALLQGVTEFLPISSYGHLVLVPQLIGWRDQGLDFDVAVHVGTLLAVLVYFHRDVRVIFVDWLRTLRGHEATIHSRLGWTIFIATIITGVAGFVFDDIVSQLLRAPIIVAAATIIFAVVLGIADHFGAKNRRMDSLRKRDAIVLGLAQALALIPGTSRSGITISAALLLGLTREAAARISFLMAIPIIVLAGVWQGRGLLAGDAVRWDILIFAAVISAAVAFVCIHWFLIFLRRHSLLPFVIYRLMLGAFLLFVFL